MRLAKVNTYSDQVHALPAVEYVAFMRDLDERHRAAQAEVDACGLGSTAPSAPPQRRALRPASPRTARQRKASAAYARQRKRVIARATPPWADRLAIAAVYAQARQATRRMGIPHSVDHVYPLQGIDSCGLHIAVNLCVITSSANSKKHNRLPEGG